MDSTKKDSKSRLIIAAVAIIAAVLIAVGAWFALSNNKASDNKSADSSQMTEQQRLNKEADELGASIKTNQDNQNNAKAALDDPSKQIKVGR